MLMYPNINPVALHVGPIKVYWYGLMYLLGIGLGWFLLSRRARVREDWTPPMLVDLVFYTALGIVLGGRIGYMFFYGFHQWSSDPFSILKVWQGGMSFHGGCLGVIVSSWLFAKRYKKHFTDVTDFLVPVVPLGLAAGRLGNFINGELWGRVTDVPWGMVFPHAGPLPRHPSQFYALFLEGITLFIILWVYSSKPRPRMAVSALFLLGYSVFRIFDEFFRQPDLQYGFIAFDWVTMGQLLSLPMFILGAILLKYAYSKLTNKGSSSCNNT